MYENILLAVDLNHDESWHKALPVALANCRQFGARLHVVMCLPDLHLTLIASHLPDGFAEKLVTESERRLEAFVAEHLPDDVDVTHALTSGGSVYEQILRYADEHDVDLIVVEAYRPDVKTLLMGSNAERIMRHAKQSVLVVRE